MSNEELKCFLKKSIADIERLARKISKINTDGWNLRGVRASIRTSLLDMRRAAARLEEAIDFATDSRKDDDEFRSLEHGVERERSG